ncbi:MAG TPA: multicopper oxidase domain-containing protein [Bryobacteraceae bacterium]|nr:multicopper oxidase domain-containing protein [Bryobacteraceae bacterium]
MTRRELLQAGLAASLLRSPSILEINRLEKFVDPLTIPPVAAIEGGQNVPRYRLAMRQIQRRIHRDLPPTTLWGFNESSPGPTIEARRGQLLSIEWINALPGKHFLPIDHSIHGAGSNLPAARAAVHLHGGRVPPESDGYPENWYAPGQSALHVYPNRQDAATLWYHDHAMGITRLNMLAGLFGFYLIRDDAEGALNLPHGQFEIPLMLYDRSLRADGQLFYPVSPDPAKPWMPEFFGDAILANGTLFPYFEAQPRKYRFRLLNASNGRFLYLSLSNGAPLVQIGSDQGLLTSPLELRRITLAPGERADVVIDFKKYSGQELLLSSDHYTILQFRIAQAPVKDDSSLPTQLRTMARLSEQSATKTRLLTLEGSGDSDDPTSMLSQRMLLNGAHWHEPVTENPRLNTVEIWSLVNLTDDSHPIHLHLVRFQILDRRAFDLFTYLNEGQLRYTSAAVPPEANEAGWKDTVRAEPGMVTRIIIRFEGFAGRYVWHCHVLEHEDNEMMRPYDVLPPA